MLGQRLLCSLEQDGGQEPYGSQQQNSGCRLPSSGCRLRGRTSGSQGLALQRTQGCTVPGCEAERDELHAYAVPGGPFYGPVQARNVERLLKKGPTLVIV